MLSSSMFFDKPAGPPPAAAAPARHSRRTAKPSRGRADSIPRHGAVDPADKYYGSQASYIGKQYEVFGEGRYASAAPSHGHSAAAGGADNSGGAMWEIYDDAPAHSHYSSAPHGGGGAGGGGGAYWDIYDDVPSYKGPSYRDLRVTKQQQTSSHSGEKPKGYEMRRSAPIDSPYTMVKDHNAALAEAKYGHAGPAAPAPVSTRNTDLSSAEVQKTVRPEGGLGFSSFDGRQSTADYKPTFLGVEGTHY